MLPATVRHGSRPACWNAIPYSWSIRACRAGLPNTSRVARGRRVEIGDQPQQRALAAAARTDQRNELAGGDLEIDVLQRDDRALATSEGSVDSREDRLHGPESFLFFFFSCRCLRTAVLPQGEPDQADETGRDQADQIAPKIGAHGLAGSPPADWA